MVVIFGLVGLIRCLNNPSLPVKIHGRGVRYISVYVGYTWVGMGRGRLCIPYFFTVTLLLVFMDK